MQSPKSRKNLYIMDDYCKMAETTVSAGRRQAPESAAVRRLEMKRYAVSKYFKITMALAIFSTCLLLCAAIDNYRCYHPIELSAGRLSLLKENQYVRLNFNHYLVNRLNFHISAAYLQGSRTYDTYTVELDDHTFIQLCVYDQSTHRAMESFVNGYGERLTVRGKVSGRVDDDNLVWYDNVADFHISHLYQDHRIIQVTEEESLSRGHFVRICGYAGLTAAVLLFFSAGGIRTVYQESFENSKTYKEWLLGRNYSLERDLQQQKERLEILKQRQGKNTLKIVLGILAAAISFFWCVEEMIQFFDLSSIVPKIAVADVLFIWGITISCRAFLNSDMHHALEISELFLQDTIPVRIDRTLKIISVLRQRMDKEQQR